ncbi:MAG: hypothetical protein F6K54_00520 [Okeania sp. SIO3B5]|uniref:hypothetical protein n=1 Tax=Okeania sp. SIO3B5 TaxID=2607811 RepID=UPI00140009DD|nr:hypothetical protein [Okeania sp. SIO3B5]NEO51713.1 hypothetical protein [Okeania sp. SIO3B5]
MAHTDYGTDIRIPKGVGELGSGSHGLWHGYTDTERSGGVGEKDFCWVYPSIATFTALCDSMKYTHSGQDARATRDFHHLPCTSFD